MIAKQLLSEQVLEDMKDFISNPYGFVLFAGKNGRGKSYVAKKVYEALARYQLPEYDREEAWFLNQIAIKSQWEFQRYEYGHTAKLMGDMSSSKFLVMDDLGVMEPSPSFMGFLYGVADNRSSNQHRLGTIITTNLSSKAMIEQFGEAFFSRVASGRNYVFTGEDRRFENLGF